MLDRHEAEDQIASDLNRMDGRSLRWALTLFFSLILLITGLLIIIFREKDLYIPFRFSSSVELIEHVYPDSFHVEELIAHARQAVFARLDRYSGYLEPLELDRVSEEFSGSYGGIGITVVGDDEGLAVMSVREDGPAGRAGIRTGDIIIRVDSTELRGLDPYRASFLLRGDEGTSVQVTIVRRNLGDSLELTLTREKLRLIHIPYAGLTQDNSLYIRIIDFESGLTEDMIGILDSLYLKNSHTVKAVIIDLRGNPGGLLNEAVTASDLFLNSGHLIVGVKGRSRWHDRRFFSKGVDITKGLPMAVLVDRGSASAAEIMAGSLKFAGRAVLVGDTTFGKGLVQEYRRLPDGAGIRLTTSRYFFEGDIFLNPSGDSTFDEGAGIPPDYCFQSDEINPFVLSLESTPLIREFAIARKDDIVTASPFKEPSPQWLEDFFAYAHRQGFAYVSPLTDLVESVRNAVSLEKHSRDAISAIDNIRNIARSDDRLQLRNFRDYIKRRIYQIALNAEYGTAAEYREAIVPSLPEIRLAEKILHYWFLN
jgi:carboxyl-terminal processing protease